MQFYLFGGLAGALTGVYGEVYRVVVVPLTTTELAVRVGAALVAGALIGIERERKHRPAGFRTMILISLGSCGFMLIAHESIAAIGQQSAGSLPAGASLPGQAELSRVLQGLIGGSVFWVPAR